MTIRNLGKFTVSSVGMGCMGFSHGYGALPPEEESIRLMRKAFDMGCTLFDTAEAYGPFVNETLVGKAVKPFRDKIVLTTKFTPCKVGDQDITNEEKLTAKGPDHLLPPPQSYLLAGLLCMCEPAQACECVCCVCPCPQAGSSVSPGMGTLKALLLQEEACSAGR